MGEVINGFRRFIHFGPMIAICIIKSITLMSLYMNSMWWPPEKTIPGFVNQTVFLMLSAMTIFNFVMASLIGPGQLPLKWRPKDKEAEQWLQYCNFCEGYKAPRSHHCQRCQRCIIKMDHHCPWINNCCGWKNQCYFINFLAFAVIGSLHATVILSASLYRGLNREIYPTYLQHQITSPGVRLGIYSLIFSVFNIGLSVGVVIAVGMLLYFQIRAVLRNRTGIEDWILEKARYRRQHTKEIFIYPYDLGYKQNIKQVLNLSCVPIGDGIHWPVIEGCDQYTLTREQLAQKFEKQQRASLFAIIKPATGSWCPIWSQGCKVGCCIPLTDEPRIKLVTGDHVRVTRWRKHWLFGEKILSDPKDPNTNSKIRIRGWFPRQCAVQTYDNESEDDQSSQSQYDVNSNGNAKKLN